MPPVTSVGLRDCPLTAGNGKRDLLLDPLFGHPLTSNITDLSGTKTILRTFGLTSCFSGGRICHSQRRGQGDKSGIYVGGGLTFPAVNGWNRSYCRVTCPQSFRARNHAESHIRQ